MTAGIDTKDRILAEARELFLRQGKAGVSMRTLGQRVGVSATALYRHFDDKEAILAALLGRAFGTFGGYLGQSLSGRTALARFRRIGELYIEFALDHPRDYELMFLTNCADLHLDKIAAELEKRARPTFELLVDRMRECIDEGLFAKRDPVEMATYAWTALHGLVSLWMFGQLASPEVAALRRQAKLTLDLIELGLRARRDVARR